MSVDPRSITHWTLVPTARAPKLMGVIGGKVRRISLSELKLSPRHDQLVEVLEHNYPKEVVTPESLEVYGDPVPEVEVRARDLACSVRGAVFDLSVIRDLLETGLSSEALEVVKHAMVGLSQQVDLQDPAI